MKRFFAFAFILAGLMHLYGGEPVLPEEEAPEALFDFSIGDKEVEFFLLGSWSFNLVGGYQYSFRESDGAPTTTTMAGLQNGYMFNNVPNLTLSIVLMKKYFLKTTVGNEFDFQEYILGYKGDPDELVREITIGNTEIGSFSLPLLNIPEAGKNALGARILMATDKSQHLFLVRSDSFAWVEEEYRGYNRISETVVPADSYKRGRFFILPDANVEGLEVYTGDPLGAYTGSDGMQYTHLDLNESRVSSEQGWIYIDSDEILPVAVYYTKGGQPVGSTGLGVNALPAESGGTIDPSASRDFDWSQTGIGDDDAVDLQVTVNSRTALKIYTPGKLSRFEHFSAYDISEKLPDDASRSSALFVQHGRETGLELSHFSIGDTLYSFFPASENFRSIAARYPLYEYSSIYPFSPEQQNPQYDLSVQSEYLMTNITLQGSIVPGSLTVKLNGQLFHDYTLNGLELVFHTPISPSDLIELRYQLANGSADDSAYITLGTKNDFLLGENDKLHLSGGLQWGRHPLGYSAEGAQSPGSVTITSGYEHKSDNLKFSLHAGVSLSTPDTAGIYEVAGMNGGDIALTVSEQRISPASVPSAYGALPALGDRGHLLFKNYYTTSSSGVKILEAYNEARDAEDIYSYTDGHPCGPYLAGGGSDVVSGNVLVCDYELEPDNSWIAANIHTGNPYLLKSSEHMSISLLGEGSMSGIEVYLQFGALAEDSDDDGILDEEASVYSAGFPFNDGILTLYFGANEFAGDVLHTEDLNRNGLPDAEIPGNVITRNLTESAELSNSWQSREIIFSDAERQALAWSPAVRVVIVNTNTGSGEQRSGRVIIGNINYSGSSIEAVSDTGEVQVYEVTDLSRELETAFDGHVLFDARDNAYVRIVRTGDPEITAAAIVSPVIPDQYNKTGFFVKRNNASAGGTDIAVSGWAGTRELYSYAFAVPDDTDWHDVCWDFSENTLVIDGSPATLISSSRSFNYSEMDRIELVISGDPDDSLSLDEFYLADADISFSAGAKQDLEWKIPSLKYYVGKFALIDKFKIRQTTSYTEADFSPGFYNASTSRELYSSTGLSATLIGIETELEASLEYAADQFDTNGSQKFRLPVGQVFSVSDSYSTSGREKQAYHTLSTKITVPAFLSLSVSHTASGEPGLFHQDWKTELKSNPDWVFNYVLTNTIRNSGIDSTMEIVNYFSGMGKLYPLIVPVYPEDTNRLITTNGTFSFTFPQIVFSWKPELSIQHAVPQPDLFLLKGNSTVSIPVKISPKSARSAELSFNYTRKFEIEVNDDGAYLADDFMLMAEHTGLQDYILTEIPFYEFFVAPDLELHDNETQIRYLPEISLNYTRRHGSFLSDLFLPSRLAFSLTREYVFLDAMSSDAFKISGSLANNALNLFGSKGTHTLFRFYESDEYLTQFTWSGNRTDEEFEHSWSLVNQIKLLFTANNILTIQNNAEKTTEDIIREKVLLRYQWQRKLSDSAKIPLIGRYSESKFLVHSEEASFLLKDEEKERSWSIIVSHSSEIKVEKKLSLMFYLKLGFQNIDFMYDDYEDTEYTVAVEGGFTGKMIF
ncbi:MAG: hypothetical protein JW874_11490 [Spirochaetales bacterium]|nr:hypothetical protein [Spirochaetales bacterium]